MNRVTKISAYLAMGLFIAMALVFLTMVFQFNSLFQPFLILFGILLSLGGVFWGLLIVNQFSALVNFVTAGAADLRHVTFAILMSGVGIIGDNGCGKSSILKSRALERSARLHSLGDGAASPTGKAAPLTHAPQARAIRND